MAEFSAGQRLAGKYTFVGLLGRGGMGDVWAARDESGAEAIKVLRKDREVDQAEERFRHEARVAARVHHPNIARVHEIAEAEDGALLLVMERLLGETLRVRLGSGPLAPSAVVEIALPVLDALAVAHDAGVVHRDVTPANIFLSQSGPKLIDFGVAKSNDQIVMTKNGHALGTPQYMAPEQIRAQPLDGRADLFSLAVTMYEALTEQNPFKRSSISGSLAAVLESEPPAHPAIPPGLWRVLQRGLQKRREERYASALEMAADLRDPIATTPSL